MKGSFNFEFGEGDIRKFIEDLGRRWTLNTIHDVLKHINDPGLSQLFREILRNGVAAGRAAGRRSRVGRPPPAEYEEVFSGERDMASPPWGPPPPWGPGPPPPYQQPFVGGAGPVPYTPPHMHPGMHPPHAQPGVPPNGIAEEILKESRRAGPHEAKRCIPVEANRYQDDGWLCHECGVFNGVQRSVCRHCQHERCDDIVAPGGAPQGGMPS
jgi:hypothetical protein